MICAWIETSSALTGSSATIIRGGPRECASDPDPLPLTARELVRVTVAVGRIETDPPEELRDPLAPLPGADTLKRERLRDDRLHRHPRSRLEYGSWKIIWRPRRDTRSSLGGMGHIAALEPYRAAGRFDKADDRPPRPSLAGAGLPDGAKSLAGSDRERHAVDRTDVANVPLDDDPAADREMDGEISYLNERRGIGVHRPHRRRRGGRYDHGHGRVYEGEVAIVAAWPAGGRLVRRRRVVAGDPVRGIRPGRDDAGVRLERPKQWAFAPAHVESPCAARRERAADRLVAEVRWAPLDRDEQHGRIRPGHAVARPCRDGPGAQRGPRSSPSR